MVVGPNCPHQQIYNIAGSHHSPYIPVVVPNYQEETYDTINTAIARESASNFEHLLQRPVCGLPRGHRVRDHHATDLPFRGIHAEEQSGRAGARGAGRLSQPAGFPRHVLHAAENLRFPRGSGKCGFRL